MNQAVIVSASGLPFSDSDAAHEKARILSYEVGESYQVVPYQNGYAVTPAAVERKQQPVLSPTDSLGRDKAIPVVPVVYPGDTRSVEEELEEDITDITGTYMMQKDDLDEDEEGLYLHPANQAYIPNYIAAFISIFLVLVVDAYPAFAANMMIRVVARAGGLLGVFLSLYKPMVNIFTYKYFVGPETVRSYEGLFSKTLKACKVQEITSVDVKQNFIQMMLKVGDVRVATPGAVDYEIVFRNIASPAKIRKRILDFIKK